MFPTPRKTVKWPQRAGILVLAVWVVWKGQQVAAQGSLAPFLKTESLGLAALGLLLILIGWVKKRRIEDKSRARFL
jgi:hypothetical protein